MLPEKIVVGGETLQVRPLFTRAQIEARVAQMAQEINQLHGDTMPLTVLIVLHGALLFGADLVRYLTMPTEISTVRIGSYEGTKSTGQVQLLSALPNLANQHVLLVEDIIDTGKSICFLKEILAKAGVASVRIATLLDKPEMHGPEASAQFVGFSIKKNFVIGYGLDLDGRYRNLPLIAELIKPGITMHEETV